MADSYRGSITVIGPDGSVLDIVRGELDTDPTDAGRIIGTLYPSGPEAAIASWAGPIDLRIEGHRFRATVTPGPDLADGQQTVHVQARTSVLAEL